MAGLLDDTIDDGTEDADPGAPLGGLSAGTADDWRAELQKRAADREKAVRDIYAPQHAMWDRMAEELRAQRVGPKRSERLYEISAALAQPTKYRGIGAVMGNLAPVLGRQQAARRTAEDERQTLLQRYAQSNMGVSTDEQKALLDVGGDIDTLRQRYFANESANARAAATAARPQYVVNPLTGEWMQKPGTGGAPDLAPASAPGASAAAAHPTPMALTYLAQHPETAADFVSQFPDYAAVAQSIVGGHNAH